MTDCLSDSVVRRTLRTARDLEANGRRSEARYLYQLIASQIEGSHAGAARRVGAGTAIGFGLISILVPGGGLAAAAVWAGLGYLAGSKGAGLASSVVAGDLRDEAVEGMLRLRKAG
jgi:hypothetical protein